MKKKSYRRNFKGSMRTQPNSELEDRAPKDAGQPARNYSIDPSFTKKSFKDLRFGSITVPVNPAGEISKQSDPYAVINSTNVVVDAKYAGQDNTSGSIVPQLPNGSTSTFRNMPDSLQLKLMVNLYFCKLSANSNADTITDSNSNTYGTVNKKMMIPYEEILNTIAAEAFYDLPFFKWTTKSSPVYTPDGLLDVLLNYQIVIQAVSSVPLRYRVIRSLEKHLKDMCYMNGAQRLNALFGRLKKSAFINLVKSVSESLIPHYLDNYWFSQIAMLVAIPCRKSNSMVDPLIDIIPEYEINTDLEVYANKDAGTALIDMADFNDLMTAVNDFIEKTSPQYLLSLARNSLLSTTAINNWINGLTDDLDTIISGMDSFTKHFADLLVAFKRMTKVGVTEWKLGNFVNVDKLEDSYQPKFNKLIYDIVKSTMTGGTDVIYDPITNKWGSLTLWDKFLGINTYDYKSGGSILTFSTHAVDRSLSPESVSVPILFYGAGTSNNFEITALTRGNVQYTISRQNIAASSWTTEQEKIFGRLIPLESLEGVSIMYPYADISIDPLSPYDNYNQGWIQNMMTDIFGYSAAKTGEDDDSNDIINYDTSTDSLCFVDVEIDDQTNAVETFVRQHSPFRVIKATYENYLGFETKK